MPIRSQSYLPFVPYHVFARCNNREWFSLPLSEVWKIFIEVLERAGEQRQLRPHAFVLMANHYHLLCSTTEAYDLGQVMQFVQRSCSHYINKATGRINHVFGGTYRKNLIRDPGHYALLYRYLAQNPVQAGVVLRVEEYPYSTFASLPAAPSLRCVPSELEEKLVAMPPDRLLDWLNELYSAKKHRLIAQALRKPEFELGRDEKTRKSLRPEELF